MRIPVTYQVYNRHGDLIEKQKLTAFYCSEEKPPIIEIALPEEYGGHIFKSILITPQQLKKLARWIAK